MLIVLKDTVTGEEQDILYKRPDARFDMATVRRAIAIAMDCNTETDAIFNDLKPISFHSDKYGKTAAFIVDDGVTVFYGVMYTVYNESYVRDRNSRLLVIE